MPPELMHLPGHERLAHFVDGSAPLSGIQLLTGVRPVSADRTCAVFELVVGPNLLDRGGALPLGAIATLADGALGWAVVGALRPGSSCATVGINLSLLHGVTRGAKLRATARLVSIDDRTALSSAVIVDADDRIVADGSARSVVYNRGPIAGGAPYVPPDHVDALRWLDDVPVATSDLAGIDAIQAIMRGERVSEPVDGLLGIEVAACVPGDVTVLMPADTRVEQTMGAVQGGALALLADRAMATAVLSTLPAGLRAHMVDVHTSFARSQAADGQALYARAEVRHRGRRLALVTVTITNAKDELVAFGCGTAAIAPAVRP